MIIDARNLPSDASVDCDICIVGGGAAGISMARELIGKSYKVCLLESGGFEINGDKLTDSLRDGENVGLPYFPIHDLTDRGLGGNTERWASSVTPMDEIDFEKRSWVPESGWPFTRQELMPYYDRANRICGVGEFEYRPDQLSKNVSDPAYQILPISNGLETKMWRYHIPPLHWRDAYAEELKKADNIETYIFANAVEIEARESGQEITRIKVACVSGNSFWVSARIFILATGGVEIPRLMLASNRIYSNGIGNNYDLVGRYFMEHPHFNRSATYIAKSSTRHYPGLYSWQAAGQYGIRAGISPSRELQEREQLLNYTVRLQGNKHPLVNTLLADNLPKSIQGLFRDLGCCVNSGIRNNKVSRKILKMTAAQPLVLDFLVMSEQAPNPDSRITLSPDKDMLGLKRVRLDWRMTELDRYTAIRMPQIIKNEVESVGLGKIKINFTETSPTWPEYDLKKGIDTPYLVGGWHFMGTTRMDVDPKHGVVDENCRVHGIDNLYIASSSVFPTVGYANPTLTIIALALRLVEHIEQKLSTSQACLVSQ